MDAGLDAASPAARLAMAALLMLTNGFFVAAEFSLVKVRSSQLDTLLEAGSGRARTAAHIHRHLEVYLHACQLGNTLASLALGWLAEPAVTALLLDAASAVGWQPSSPGLLRGVAPALALLTITLVHMTVGEQVPKLWAIHRAERTVLAVALPLQAFTFLFRPLIWVIQAVTNAVLRIAGVSAAELDEASTPGAEELRRIVAASAEAGHISERQRELAQNVLGIIELEVRHILVPRVDVVYLSLQRSMEENLEIIHTSGHSRFPLCEVGLDTVIGIVHAKQLIAALAKGQEIELQKSARAPVFVSDTQQLSRFTLQLQRTRDHCSVVVDEHGTAIGLAFLQDAVEEIVGPLHDEFDQAEPTVTRLPSGGFELPGTTALPEASELLDLGELSEDEDTIGGVVVARLGRLPERGDTVSIGRYQAMVLSVRRHRIDRLRFEPLAAPEQDSGSARSPADALLPDHGWGRTQE